MFSKQQLAQHSKTIIKETLLVLEKAKTKIISNDTEQKELMSYMYLISCKLRTIDEIVDIIQSDCINEHLKNTHFCCFEDKD